jgi:hypothetical protein
VEERKDLWQGNDYKEEKLKSLIPEKQDVKMLALHSIDPDARWRTVQVKLTALNWLMSFVAATTSRERSPGGVEELRGRL